MTASEVAKRTKRLRAQITPALIDEVCERLAQSKRVRRTLPEDGRLHVDRPLPFLCVYRRPEARSDAGTARLVKGEAAYLIAPGGHAHHRGVVRLVEQLARTMVAEFGAVLILELWAGRETGAASDAAVPSVSPRFEIISPPSASMAKTVEVLARRLQSVRVLKQSVEVDIIDDAPCDPPGMQPLLSSSLARNPAIRRLGLVVPPVYRDAKSGTEFPMLTAALRRSVSRVLKQAFHQFTLSKTTHRPPHYNELGRRAVVKAVWQIDRQLVDISSAFDFLIQVTPVNGLEAWETFKRTRSSRAPELHYRPATFDTSLLKRRLYRIPIERVEDPALQTMFHEKQQELDRKITMLADRDTPRFLYGSLMLYGGVEPTLLDLARDVMAQTAPPKPAEPAAKPQTFVGAEELARAAEKEFAHYRALHPDFVARTRISSKIAGIMVSRGVLLINSATNVARSRVEPLLHHEVGTHLLTYNNGRAQPLNQLYSGLAGYDPLQEGLAVLAEYLVGGLETGRIRQLAARVIAADQLVAGATFVETYRTLTRRYGFSKLGAFRLTVRIYRGGGLTKDAVYLRGLEQTLGYVANGGSLDTLFLGKFAVNHIPMIKELRLRGVLREPPLRPRYMSDEGALERLAALRGSGASVLDLMVPTPRPVQPMEASCASASS